MSHKAVCIFFKSISAIDKSDDHEIAKKIKSHFLRQAQKASQCCQLLVGVNPTVAFVLPLHMFWRHT